MTIAYSDFISAFPEFTSTQTYPQAQVNFWITQGYAQLNARRFGTQIDLAVMLFVAHNVVLSARAAATAASGAPVGEASGPVSSKSVGPVSVNYATDATEIAGAGAWNYTSYGQRLYKMMQAYGSGPAYVRGPRRAFGFPIYR